MRKSCGTDSGRWALAALGLAAALVAAAPGQARADWDGDDGWHRWHHWHHWHDRDGGWGWRPPVVYAPPRVYVAPPPVIYAPPPVIYAPRWRYGY